MSAKGSKYTCSFFQDSKNRDKLLELLSSFYAHPGWQLDLNVSEVEQDFNNTVHAVEERAELKSQADRVQQVLSYPAVKELMDIFPGTELEKFKLK